MAKSPQDSPFRQEFERVIEPRKGWRVVDFPELVRRRDLFFHLILRDIKVLYRQTVLGLGWAILRPLFSMVVFSVVFGRLAKVPSDGIPYPLFSYVALVPWTYFQSAMTASTTSLISGSQLLSKAYFPRVYVPLAPVIAGLVDFVIALAVVGALMRWYGTPVGPGILMLPVLIIIMVITAASVGLWFSVLAVQYRDVRFAIQFVSQLLMYAAPVVWPASLIPEKFRVLYGLYPMAGVIEGFRSSLLGATPMPWDLIGMGALSSSFFFIIGLFYFRRVERILADVA